MKICHVCKAECEDSIDLCPVCGADLSVGEEEEIEAVESAEEVAEVKKEITEPVLVAAVEDVVSAEIFKDILLSNGIPFSSLGEEEGNSMRVVFGGGFSAEEIYVDNSDLEKASQLYSEFLESETNFGDEFFDEEFTEEEV